MKCIRNCGENALPDGVLCAHCQDVWDKDYREDSSDRFMTRAEYNQFTEKEDSKKMPFGKHKGKLYSEIDTPYLRWLSATIKDQKFQHCLDAVLGELKKRGMS